jgi:hypothetical protein
VDVVAPKQVITDDRAFRMDSRDNSLETEPFIALEV